MNVPKLRFKEFDGEWEENTFRDITKLSQGLQIAISNRFLEGGDNREFYITNEFLNPKSQKKYYIENPPKNVIANEEDILMTRTGNTGKVVTNVRGAFHNNFFKVAYDSNNIYKLFLYYLLNSKPIQKEILVRAGTSTIPDLNHNDFYRIKINLPNKEEQKKIGNFFEILNKKIQLQQQKIDLLQEQKKGFLQKMFPKAGETQPEMRFDGFIGDWEECKLREVANHRGGTAIEKYFDDNGDYKVISIGSYGLDNKYVDQNIRAISNDITDSRLVKKGELTMVLNDKTSNGTIIGRSLLIEKDNEFVVNQRTEIISPKTDLDSAFAYVTLNGSFREKVRKIVQGGTQIYVNYSAVENLNLFVPQIEEQKKIGSFFKQLDNVITFQQQKLELFQKQKDGFMQQMFI